MPRAARIVWVLALVAVGIAPSIAFGVWVEALGRGAAAASAVSLPDALFDVLLMQAFGVLHTGLAQLRSQERMARAVGAANVRALYMIATGAALCGVMGAWRPLGGAVWTVVAGSERAELAGQVAFYLLLLLAGRMIAGSGALEFAGVAQAWRGAAAERTAGKPYLVEDGVYAVVRHPGYAVTLLAFLTANTMTRDRMALFAGSAIYLAIGIPLEERKLVAIFGDAYVRYRARVPALLPRLR